MYHFSDIDYNIIQIFAPTATFRRYKLPSTLLAQTKTHFIVPSYYSILMSLFAMLPHCKTRLTIPAHCTVVLVLIKSFSCYLFFGIPDCLSKWFMPVCTASLRLSSGISLDSHLKHPYKYLKSTWPL